MSIAPHAPMHDFNPEPSVFTAQPTQPMTSLSPEQPRRPRAGLLIAGVAATAVFAGAVGGAVGYTLADNGSISAITVAPIGAVEPAAGSIAAVAAAVQPAVVQLNIEGSGGEGTGTGFIVSSDGYIVTNDHVAGPAGENGTIDITFSDGTTATGKLVGSDPGYDLAVVKVDREGLPALTLWVIGCNQCG